MTAVGSPEPVEKRGIGTTVTRHGWIGKRGSTGSDTADTRGIVMNDTDDSTLPVRVESVTTPRDHLKTAGLGLGTAASLIGGLLLNASAEIEPIPVGTSEPMTPHGTPETMVSFPVDLPFLVEFVLWLLAVLVFGLAMAEIVAGLQLAVTQRQAL